MRRVKRIPIERLGVENSVPPPLREIGVGRIFAFLFNVALFVVLEVIDVESDLGFDTNAAARRIGDEIRAMTNRVDRSFREFNFVDRFSLELLFAGEEIGRPVRFFVDVLFLEIRGDDRHVDEVAEARVNGSFVRDLLEFLSEALGVSASRGVAASGVGGAFSFRSSQAQSRCRS